MAYGNYIASVPFAEVAEYRRDRSRPLRPTRLENVSHLVAYWVRAQPVGQLLGQTLDGGEPLAADLYHPLRPPVVHPPEAVRRLLPALRQALQAATAAGPVREVEWFRPEIDNLLALFQHAADRGEAVVSALEPPMDEERAAKVVLPFAVE